MTVAEFFQFVNYNLEQGTITMETPLGVFTHFRHQEVQIARIKDGWVPLGGLIVVLSPYLQKEILNEIGLGRPEMN